jgi:hypothetical protein
VLVSELIDLTLNQWLYPGGDEQPQFDTLQSDIDDSTDTIVLSGRAEFVPRDTLLEIGGEQILVFGSSGSTVTVAQRGFAGTTPAAHAAGTVAWIDPSFTRKELLNALRGLIGKLITWGVYDRYVDTSNTFDNRGVLTAPARTQRIHSITVRRATSSVEQYTTYTTRGTDWIEYNAFDPLKFQIKRANSIGQTMNVVCVRDFDLPDSESDDLTVDIRIPVGLQEDLPMALAGQVLKGRQVPQALVDRIREVLASNGQNPGIVGSIGDALLNAFKRDAIVAERRRLDSIDEPGFEWQARR